MYCNATIVYKWEIMQICKNRFYNFCDFAFYLESASVKPLLLQTQLNNFGFLFIPRLSPPPVFDHLLQAVKNWRQERPMNEAS